MIRKIWILLLLCFSLGACQQEKWMTVVLHGSDERVERLDITLQTLQGKIRSAPPLHGNPERIDVQIPPGISGRGTLVVLGIGTTGCAVLRGEGDFLIGQDLLDLEMKPDGCGILVEQLGLGSGRVCVEGGACCSPSSEVGQVKRCHIPANPPFARISAEPSPGSNFVGWHGACKGLAGCDLTIGATSTKVQVVFDSNCRDNGFCWEHPMPPARTFNRIFGLSERDIWAVGQDGIVKRSTDGISFAPIVSLGDNPLYGIWGSHAAGMWVVGDSGAIWHYHNGRWDASPVDVCPMGQALFLRDVWGAGPDDVWAVGFCGEPRREVPSPIVLHYKDKRWQRMPLPVDGKRPYWRLLGVWGSPPDAEGKRTVIAVGDFGTVLRLEEHEIVRIDVPKDKDRNYETVTFNAAWGDAPGSFFVVGSRLAILRYSSNQWRPISLAPGNSDPKIEYTSIWGSSADNYWLTVRGGGGVLVHFLGDTKVTVPTPANIAGHSTSVWGSGPNDVWFVGYAGVIQRWNGIYLSSLHGQPSLWPLLSIVANPNLEDDVWAAGWFGTLLHRQNGIWQNVRTPVGADLRAIWSGQNDSWIVGSAGTILHMNNQRKITALTITDVMGNRFRTDTLWTSVSESQQGAANQPRSTWIAGEGKDGVVPILIAEHGEERPRFRTCEINVIDGAGNRRMATAWAIQGLGPRRAVAVVSMGSGDHLTWFANHPVGAFLLQIHPDEPTCLSLARTRDGTLLKDVLDSHYLVSLQKVGRTLWAGGCKVEGEMGTCEGMVLRATEDVSAIWSQERIPGASMIVGLWGTGQLLWALGAAGDLWQRPLSEGDQTWRSGGERIRIELATGITGTRSGKIFVSGDAGGILRKDP